MLIPQLSVGTYVVVFKLIRLLDAPFVHLILWLAFLFVPWWYRCHILSIWRRDRCWVIEFIFVGYWFVSLVIPCIHSANEYYIVLRVLLVRDELVWIFDPSFTHTNWISWHVLWPVSVGVFLWFWFDRCTNESVSSSLGLECICVSVHWYEFFWALFWLRNSSMSFAFD